MHSAWRRVHGWSGRRLDVMPMSPAKAPAFCSSTLGTAAFQPNRPRISSPGCRRIRHEVGPPGDAVAVLVVRIGQVEDVVLRHALEQADAEHRGRDARRQQEPVDRLAVGPDHLVVRFDEGVRGAVVVARRRPPRA